MKMLNDVIQDLEFISRIPKNSKPNFSDKTYISKDVWFSTFRRRLKYERGEKGVIYLNDLIEKIKDILPNLDSNSFSKIKIYLQKAQEGVKNLIETYQKDNQENVSSGYQKNMEEITHLIRFKPFFNYIPRIETL